MHFWYQHFMPIQSQTVHISFTPSQGSQAVYHYQVQSQQHKEERELKKEERCWRLVYADGEDREFNATLVEEHAGS